jgi:prepilin-type N-terminal cleavage/methylation domain-containing protein
MAIWGVDRKDNGIKGFSLVEILTVIAIIAILLTIVPSMFSAFRQRTNLREAAGALAEDMKLAKQRAVAENVKYSITFNISSNNYTMNNYDPNGNMNALPIKTVNLSDFGKGISILNQNYSGGNSGTITFYTRGTCSGPATGMITLQNSLNSTKAITTNPMGRVKIN